MAKAVPLEATHTTERVARLSRAPWFLIAAGTLFRLVWPLDMEWKLDEKWMFQAAERIANGSEPWPWVGMQSGAGMRNPGLSIWPFAALGYLFDDPVAMVQTIQWVNVLALWGFAAWVTFNWDEPDRRIGLWGVALYAVSPLAVLFSRKLWAQDLLVFFVLPWLWGHQRRDRVWGAVLWGACGALLGQLHMSGFFAAFALACVTLLRDRKRFPWWPWIAGSALGALPLLPWIMFLFSPEAPAPGTGRKYTIAFLSEALRHVYGLGLGYPLGDSHREFLRGPIWFGAATHLNDVLRYGLVGLLLFTPVALLLDRKRLRVPEPVAMYLGMVVLSGLLMTLVGLEIHAHYLIVFGPVLHIGAAWALQRRGWAIALLCSFQMLLSASFLTQIHRAGGAPDDDYGRTYRVQSEQERSELGLPLSVQRRMKELEREREREKKREAP